MRARASALPAIPAERRRPGPVRPARVAGDGRRGRSGDLSLPINRATIAGRRSRQRRPRTSTDVHVGGKPPAGARPSRSRCRCGSQFESARVQLARPLERHRQHPLEPAPDPAAAVRRRDRARGRARPPRRPAGARAAGRGRRDRAAHRRDRGPVEPASASTPTTRSASSPGASTRCSSGSRALASRARRVGARAAPARRRRLARAAHPVTSLRTNIEVLLAGGELTDEDRAPAARRRRRAERGAERADRRPDRARPRRPADHRGRGRPARSARRGVADARAAQLPRDPVRELARAGDRRRRPGAARARGQQPARQRRPPLRRRRHRRGRSSISTGVRVRDHGTGVDQEDLPYVFDRFFRGANSRHRQGSGLGLAIVRQVAEQHGGSVEAANAPDGGAVVHAAAADRERGSARPRRRRVSGRAAIRLPLR